MRNGFTLIELLIVIAIVAILAGAMVPMINFSRAEARRARAMADLDSIKTACIMYHYDTSDWPGACSDGGGLLTDTGTANWDGPYLDNWSNDPWEDAYQLVVENINDLIAVSGGDAAITSPPAAPNIWLLITSDNTK